MPLRHLLQQAVLQQFGIVILVNLDVVCNMGMRSAKFKLPTCTPKTVHAVFTKKVICLSYCILDILAHSQVDFVPLRGRNIAVDVKVKATSLGDDEGIIFKRNPVNAELKAKVAPKITMAEGPPSEAAVGFEYMAMREEKVDIDNLPWAALLVHLHA